MHGAGDISLQSQRFAVVVFGAGASSFEQGLAGGLTSEYRPLLNMPNGLMPEVGNLMADSLGPAERKWEPLQENWQFKGLLAE